MRSSQEDDSGSSSYTYETLLEERLIYLHAKHGTARFGRAAEIDLMRQRLKGKLTDRQLANAKTVILVGYRLELSEYACVVAIATALQESTLRNLANPNVPESLNHPNDGTGTDHDSVGLFQQRHTMGWGTVAELMTPEYSATKFYRTLVRVKGWENMPVWEAAQRVQRSAFPYAYANHEDLAWEIVRAYDSG